jgi:glutaredoxin
MLLKLLRNGLGMVIVLISNLTLPKQQQRSVEAQSAAQNEADKLSLYQFYACPFCIKTRRTIHALNIKIAYKDASNNADYREELLTQGGEIKVPCLKIEKDGKTEWMYESSEIISYLNKRFAA